MTRTVTASMTAAFALQRSEVVHLLSMEFSGGTVRLTDASQDIVWGGTTWLAEDTFVESSSTDLESHTPTGGLSVDPGFGGYTYNANSLAPTTNDMQAKDYDAVGVGLATSEVMRSRSTSNIAGPGARFKVYANFGRAAVCFFGVRAGVRILVDGSAAEDTEKDGIDVYLVDDGSCTRGHLQVDEYVSGSLVGTESFYTDTGTDDLPWGLNDANPYGLSVEFRPGAGANGYGQVALILGDTMSEGSYANPANPQTLYTSGDVVGNTYDLASDRTGKERMGQIVSGETSGTGTILAMAVEMTNIYSAVGGAMSFEGVQETPDLAGQSVNFILDGVSQIAIAAFLGEGYIGRLARLYRAHIDTDGTIIPDPVTLFHGYMNSAWDVSESWDEERGASSSTVKTTFVSPLVKFQQKRGIRADMTSHQRKYASDTFFSHIAAIPDGDIGWGAFQYSLGDFIP